MKKLMILSMVVLAVALLAGYVWASDTKTITATAVVPTINPTFNISIFKSLTKDTYDWNNPISPSTGMNFGTLTNAVKGDPTSALAAEYHFLVLVGVLTNTGNQYAVKYTGASLQKGSDKIPAGAWTVSAGKHYNPDTKNPAGITTGIHSAEDTYVVYNSNPSGQADSFRLYFAITGDPSLAADKNDLIPPTQPAGTYSGTVKLDVYSL